MSKQAHTWEDLAALSEGLPPQEDRSEVRAMRDLMGKTKRGLTAYEWGLAEALPLIPGLPQAVVAAMAPKPEDGPDPLEAITKLLTTLVEGQADLKRESAELKSRLAGVESALKTLAEALGPQHL